MEHELYQKLLAEVRDEQLLWHGAPEQGVRVRPIDGTLFIISLFWSVFSIFLFVSALLHDASFIMTTVLSFFVIFCLYFTFGRFLTGSWRRSHTYYGLTDRRALIINGRDGNGIESLNLALVSEVNLETNGDGSGSVLFGAKVSTLRVIFNPFASKSLAIWAGCYGVPAFEEIPDARSVYDLVVRAQQSKTRKE